MITVKEVVYISLWVHSSISKFKRACEVKHCVLMELEVRGYNFINIFPLSCKRISFLYLSLGMNDGETIYKISYPTTVSKI